MILSATVTTSTSFELASSHARVISIKSTKQQLVSKLVTELVTRVANNRIRVKTCPYRSHNIAFRSWHRVCERKGADSTQECDTLESAKLTPDSNWGWCLVIIFSNWRWCLVIIFSNWEGMVPSDHFYSNWGMGWCLVAIFILTGDGAWRSE